MTMTTMIEIITDNEQKESRKNRDSFYLNPCSGLA